MSLSIRAARPEDAFRLVPLIHAFASDVAESATTGPGGVARHALGPDRVVTTLLAETDGRVVGFARALMAAVGEQCRAEGGQWIEWEVWRKNPPALAFYERIGARDRTGLLSMVLEGEACARLAATPRDG